MRFVDLTGQRFVRLLVVARVGNRGPRVTWKVVCDCGETGVVLGCNLTSGNTRSCGCLNREVTLARVTTHGESKTAEYDVWTGIKNRCANENEPAFKNYGGRGIRVCVRWLDSFENFLLDVGRRPSAMHTLERVNNDGNYEPGNVRWATRTEQSRNRRSNKMLTFGSETMCLAAWAERVGLSSDCIAERLRLGWSIDQALTLSKGVRRGT